MATTKTHEGVPWDGRTAYERWVEDDLGLDLHRGYFANNLKKVAVKPWEERGISAAFYDIIGAESLAGMYVGEIAPGRSGRQAQQLCDEVIFVIGGRGTTMVETPKGQVSFEWGPNSLFAIPLNHPYQMHNSSGREPARFVSVNTIPIVYNLFRDSKFVFGGCDWQFDRINADAALSDSVLYKPDAKHERTAVNLHETTFVPDIFNVQRTSFAERGSGNKTVYFELANSVISAHFAEHPGLQFFNPHRHGPSAFVFTLQGSGYTLMWQEGRKEERFDWPEDDFGVVVPPNMWWHGHFGTSPVGFQLAIKLRSRKYPINHLYDKTHKHVSEGGTLLHYKDLEENLRNRVWQTYVEECRRRGHEVKDPNTR